MTTVTENIIPKIFAGENNEKYLTYDELANSDDYYGAYFGCKEYFAHAKDIIKAVDISVVACGGDKYKPDLKTYWPFMVGWLGKCGYIKPYNGPHLDFMRLAESDPNHFYFEK